MMFRYELYDRNGNLVQQTEREETKEEKLLLWQSRIAATDAKLPRAIEDIIDALDLTTKAKIAKQTMDAYQEKKTIRQQQPQ